MQIVNAPGRFDAAPDLLAHDLTRWTAGPTSAVFLTEVADPARAAVLPRGGWTVAHKGGAGQGESAILTRDRHYTKILATRWLKVWDGGGKGRLAHPMYAVAVAAETVNGHVDVLTSLHTPAHVEGLWAHLPLSERVKAKVLERQMKSPARVRTYLQVMHAWRDQTMALAAEFHADDVIAAPDGNLDAHKPWVPKLLARAWPGMNLAATKAPDLGKRTVGWVLTTMTVGASRVRQAKGSDHDAGVYTFTRANQVPVKHQKAGFGPPPDPFARCTYNGALMDNKTKVAVQTLEAGPLKDLAPLTIFQGCYSNGAVAASAGTHDGGGVLDFAPAFYGRKVKAWRELCGPAWHRPFNWDGIGGGEHIHVVMAGEGRLSPGAAQQVTEYVNGENGLALHARDTNTYHPKPTYNYATAWTALQASAG